MNAESFCPRCNARLSPDAPLGLCPKCLILVGGEASVPPTVGAASGDEGLRRQARFEPPAVEELAALFPQMEILELLGRGGMGAVYKARHKGLDRLAAVKILPPDVGADPAFADRFLREARALAKLHHPGIVAVYDFGQAGGLYYIVMEYVDGADLRQAIRSGTLAPAEALAIVPQVCDALQYAHDEGVVHRDVKPENILLDRRGRVKIADFGLAKLLAQAPTEPTLTATRQVMGTPRYMAPEQLDGDRGVDHRADIYSLGVVFYELLTGELPVGRFDVPSRKVRVDVRLDDVVLRSLEVKPERRYQHVSEVKTDLASIAATPGGLREVTRDKTYPRDGNPTASATFASIVDPDPATSSWGVYVIAVLNGIGAVLLMFLLASDTELRVPVSAGTAWRSWEYVSQYLSYALYSITMLASVGLALRKAWGRTLTLGTCWAALAAMVTDTPYIAKFYIPGMYQEIVDDFVSEGMGVFEAESFAFLAVSLFFGAGMFLALGWLLAQAIYLNRPRIAVEFEGHDGRRPGAALSRPLVWLPAVTMLTIGGAAFAYLVSTNAIDRLAPPAAAVEGKSTKSIAPIQQGAAENAAP